MLLVPALAAVAMAQSPIGHWSFDGDGADSSGGGRHLDLVGGVGFAAGSSDGALDQALDLHNDGSQYAVRPLDDPIYDFGTNDFTIEVSVNFNNTSREQVLVEKFESSGGPGWTLSKLQDDSLHFYCQPATALFSAPLSIPSGVWHHIVVRRNGTRFQILFNCTVVAESFSSAAVPDTAFPLRIGRRNHQDSRNMAVDGRIDEVVIWPYGLSDDEACAPDNRAPLAASDFYGINQASALTVPTPGILANDSDPDEDALTVELVTAPAHADSFQLNPDGSFSYTPPPYFFGEDTFTYRAYDGADYSELASVHVTVRQPDSRGFITGGGKLLQDGRKCTFGFVAKVEGTGVQGNLEFQDHGASVDVKSQGMHEVHAANQTEGYFSGSCKLNGVDGYSFFVLVSDRGQPGSNDDLAIWIFDSLSSVVYSASGLLAGGNIVIHGN